MTWVADTVAGLALILAVLGTSQFVGPMCEKYILTNDSLQFVMFGQIKVWKCPFFDIIEISQLSFLNMLFIPGLHLMTKPFARYILIRRRRAIFRYIVITPDNADQFIHIVRRKMGKT